VPETRSCTVMRTQVIIIGAGPAGMLLSHLLEQRGIASVVVEQRSKEYVAARIRAGVLEQGSVDVLRVAGLGERMDREGYRHEGVFFSTAGHGFRIDFEGLTGRAVTVYGQTEVQKDLYAAAEASGRIVIDEAEDVAVHDTETSTPWVTFRKHDRIERIDGDVVAGCDGFHGVCRTVIPPSIVRSYERIYPFGWLGILSETPPVSHELIYAQHERGFALCSMRNEMLSRYYVQCELDDAVESWTDARFWDELRRRIPQEAADRLVVGPSIEKSITPLRSFVAEPMRWGRLFLAGDAAHIVPPTGAKGLNLAVSDVVYLAEAFGEFFAGGSEAAMDAYSDRALARVWKAVRFSWWMTTLLHRFTDTGEFGQRIQETELAYLSESRAAQAALAENYTGLPL
jgi:p-hydroxybenzoate 3-monooxygenase